MCVYACIIDLCIIYIYITIIKKKDINLRVSQRSNEENRGRKEKEESDKIF